MTRILGLSVVLLPFAGLIAQRWWASELRGASSLDANFGLLFAGCLSVFVVFGTHALRLWYKVDAALPVEKPALQPPDFAAEPVARSPATRLDGLRPSPADCQGVRKLGHDGASRRAEEHAARDRQAAKALAGRQDCGYMLGEAFEGLVGAFGEPPGEVQPRSLPISASTASSSVSSSSTEQRRTKLVRDRSLAGGTLLGAPSCQTLHIASGRVDASPSMKLRISSAAARNADESEVHVGAEGCGAEGCRSMLSLAFLPSAKAALQRRASHPSASSLSERRRPLANASSPSADGFPADGFIGSPASRPPLVQAGASGSANLLSMPVEGAEVSVLLHVYDVSQTTSIRQLNRVLAQGPSWLKFGGVFHAGVEILGKEWSFGYSASGTGVSGTQPRKHPMHTFRETVDMGSVALSKEEVFAILKGMAEEYPGSSYHLMKRNCCTFAEDLCTRLGVGAIPPWVHRLARIGDRVLTMSQALEEKLGAVHLSMAACGGACGAEAVAAVSEPGTLEKAFGFLQSVHDGGGNWQFASVAR